MEISIYAGVGPFSFRIQTTNGPPPNFQALIAQNAAASLSPTY